MLCSAASSESSKMNLGATRVGQGTANTSLILAIRLIGQSVSPRCMDLGVSLRSICHSAILCHHSASSICQSARLGCSFSIGPSASSVGNWAFACSLLSSIEREKGKLMDSPIRLSTCHIVSANVTSLRACCCFVTPVDADVESFGQRDMLFGAGSNSLGMGGMMLTFVGAIGIVWEVDGVNSKANRRGSNALGDLAGGRTLLGPDPRSQLLAFVLSLLLFSAGEQSLHFFMKVRNSFF
jgi:hypothetical protein